MKFFSTRDSSRGISLQDALLNGMPADNGLYMPEAIPQLTPAFIGALKSSSFHEVCLKIAMEFLAPDLGEAEVHRIITESINFDAPLHSLSPNLGALELFHGPTMAFKDFGARFMARLISHFVEKGEQKLTILVATSGDTGSAVAQAFSAVLAVDVFVLYPKGKISPIQESQITTVGGNVHALQIDGVFDDCQALVKQAFTDKEILAKRRLNSANSINIARLIAQIFYYFRAYQQLEAPAPMVVSVPSGNFGNLTAGVLAKRMGLPVCRFCAATNTNKAVPDYLKSGIFRAAPSQQTISNAMDVGNPSNFERLLAIYQRNAQLMGREIVAHSFSDDETRSAMKELYGKYGYIADPHSAVAYLGLKSCSASDDAGYPRVFLATAHAAKFPEVVEPTLGIKLEAPERLASSLKKEKHYTEFSKSFADFKGLLLSSA